MNLKYVTDEDNKILAVVVPLEEWVKLNGGTIELPKWHNADPPARGKEERNK